MEGSMTDAARASATFEVALKDLQIVQGVTLPLARPAPGTLPCITLAITRGDRELDERTGGRTLRGQEGGRSAACRLRHRTRDHLQGGSGPRHGDRRGSGAGDKGGVVGNLPSYGMLAEEGGELAGEADARWIVDPLDGTTNYAHGLPIFCVSVALERAGEVVMGVVHDLIGDETFVAEQGRGATLNGEPIVCRIPTS